MDDSDPNGEKSTVVALAELVDQHASITRTLNSKLTALEDARKEIAELERQKERTLSELLALVVVKKIGEIENNFNAPKDAEVEEKVPVNVPIDAEICQTETKQSTEKAVDLKEDAAKQTFNPQDADIEKKVNVPKDAEVFQTETTQSTEKALELKEEVINRSSPLCVGPKIMNAKAESAVPGGKGQSEENKMPPQFVPAKQWEMVNVPMDAEVEKKVNAVIDAEVCRNETTQLAEKAVEPKEEAVKRICNPQDAEVKKKVNAPNDAEISRTETMMSLEAVVSKEESTKCTSNPRLHPTKLAKKRAAVSKKGQSEVKKQPRSVPVKPWERHRCLKPYKPVTKRPDHRKFTAEQIMKRKVTFYVNACTRGTERSTAGSIITDLSGVISREGGANFYNSANFYSALGLITFRAIVDAMHKRTFFTLMKEFLGELQLHDMLRNKEIIDDFSELLLLFDQNNCGFAHRILEKVKKIHERGLWCISEGYSEDEENHGKPVTPSVTRIHLKPRELLPVAVDRGCFGKTLKSAPIELKTLVGWLFVQFPTVPRLDRDLTVFLNSISHKDLQIKRYEAINSSAQRALSDEERSLLPEKILTALVVRALTSPLKSTSLYVRLLTETGKNFLSLGPMYQKRVEKVHSESIFVLVHTVLVAAIIWQRGGRKLELCLGDCPVKVRQQLSKFFAKIYEHGFYRVAWFLFCLRNHGKAQSSQINDLRTRLCIDTRPNHSKFRLLTKWLHELDRDGYISSNAIGLKENPLNMEDEFGSSGHCRIYSGRKAP